MAEEPAVSEKASIFCFAFLIPPVSKIPISSRFFAYVKSALDHLLQTVPMSPWESSIIIFP